MRVALRCSPRPRLRRPASKSSSRRFVSIGAATSPTTAWRSLRRSPTMPSMRCSSFMLHPSPVRSGNESKRSTRPLTGQTRPVIAVMLGSGDRPLRRGSSVPAFSFPEQAAAALGRIGAYSRWRRMVEAVHDEQPRAEIDRVRANAIIADHLAAGSMPPGPMRALLDSYGVDMPPTEVVGIDDAVATADSIGYPLAMKAAPAAGSAVRRRRASRRPRPRGRLRSRSSDGDHASAPRRRCKLRSAAADWRRRASICVSTSSSTSGSATRHHRRAGRSAGRLDRRRVDQVGSDLTVGRQVAGRRDAGSVDARRRHARRGRRRRQSDRTTRIRSPRDRRTRSQSGDRFRRRLPSRRCASIRSAPPSGPSLPYAASNSPGSGSPGAIHGTLCRFDRQGHVVRTMGT